jgi:hypothetical protein
MKVWPSLSIVRFAWNEDSIMIDTRTPSHGHTRPIKPLDELRAAAREACEAAYGLREEAVTLRGQLQVTLDISG